VTTLVAKAPAKINLDLRVLAREESGYHQIETTFLLVDLCDVLTVSEAPSDVSLEVVGADLGVPQENLVHRAAVGFFGKTGVGSGVRLRLEKKIPAGAGLGGGSSDAATTLRLLNTLFGEPLSPAELRGLAAELGADVPFFLTETGFALGWGRGGRMLVAPAPEPRGVVLALPGIHISTPDAYTALSAAGLGDSDCRQISMSALPDWERLAEEAVNDFEAAAFLAHPLLSELRNALIEGGAEFARMSGSGSALFGVFQAHGQAQAAADKIAERLHCDCVAVATRTRWADIEVREG